MTLEELKAKLIEFGIPAESIKEAPNGRLFIPPVKTVCGRIDTYMFGLSDKNEPYQRICLDFNSQLKAAIIHQPFDLPRFSALYYGLTGIKL